MPTPPPGWYADPAGSTQYRWWDGQDWTDALSPTAQARPPLAAGPADAEGPAAPEVETLTLGGHQHRRGLAPLALVVALALVAVGVGAWWLRPAGGTESSAPGSAASTPASSPTTTPSRSFGGQGSTPPGWMDSATGEVRIGDASMTLPGDPFLAMSGPTYPAEVFDAGFAANAPLHPKTGDAPAWYSTVALLHVPADQVGADGTSTAQRAGTAVLGYLFGDTAVKTKNLVWTPTSVGDRDAIRVSGQVWYAVDGLASTHDDITLVVVELADDSYAAAVSSVPDDAPDQVRTLADQSVASLSVR